MKREWEVTRVKAVQEKMPASEPALWAIVERLEALVGVMDDLGEVGDVIANHLTFGGQPVGDMTPHPQNWQCQLTKECTLFNGHQGACIRPHDNVVTDEGCSVLCPVTGIVCQLLAGHDGIHAFPEPEESDDVPGGYNAVTTSPPLVPPVNIVTPRRTCQCIKPQFDESNVCGRCGFSKEWQGFYAK